MRSCGQVVVVGSLNLDHVVRVDRLPLPGETLAASGLQRHAGGKGANQAAAAGRASAPVRLVGAVGTDQAGESLLAVLYRQGVDVIGVRRVAGTPTGSAVVLVSGTGENSILVVPGANAAVRPDDVALDLDGLDLSDVVLTQLETPEEVLLTLAARAGPWRLVVNASPLPDDDARLHRLWDALRMADPLVVNQVEAGRVLAALGAGSGGSPTGRDGDPAFQVRALIAHGARSAVVTAGAGGCWWAAADGLLHVPAHAAAVVDTTGAGDAFAGVLAAGLAAGRPVPDALDDAAHAGAVATTWLGAQPHLPTGPW